MKYETCNFCELVHVECICGSVSAFFEICKDLPRAPTSDMLNESEMAIEQKEAV